MAKQHKFYAVVTPGLERIAARELKSLSAHDINIEYGGISFTGTMQLLYRVNIRARTITRVLMRLRTFRSMTLEGLHFDLEKVAWHLFFDEHTELNVEVHTHHSRLNHSDEIAEFSKIEIKKLMPKLGTETTDFHKQTLHIRIDNNRGTLSLDTSGERLDKRGYRLESGKAPIRETLAAATLLWADWHKEQTLLVPMCGSGTFAIEAALLGNNQTPNLKHNFSCLYYPSFKEKEFQKVVERCQAMAKVDTLSIFASDYHEGAVEICLSNSKRASVAIQVEKQDIHDLTKPNNDKGGVLILNPPYANRLGEEKKVMSLWTDIGAVLAEQFIPDPTWKTILVCPDAKYEKKLNLPIKRRLKIKHGGLDVMLLEV